MSNRLNLMIEIIRDVHDQFFCAHSNMNRIEKFIKRYKTQSIKKYLSFSLQKVYYLFELNQS